MAVSATSWSSFTRVLTGIHVGLMVLRAYAVSDRSLLLASAVLVFSVPPVGFSIVSPATTQAAQA